MDKIAPPAPTVDEATRVINHLLSYPDHCDATLDAVRSIMQWMVFERPTEAALYRHLKMLRKPIPEGIREGVDHVPTTRHRTTMIVEGVLKGYLDWLTKNHPETGDDVEPETGAQPAPEATSAPHHTHHMLVHDSLGASPQQQEVCGYCGKTDVVELAKPCAAARRMSEEEDAYHAAESEPGEHQVVLDAINGCTTGEDDG